MNCTHFNKAQQDVLLPHLRRHRQVHRSHDGESLFCH